MLTILSYINLLMQPLASTIAAVVWFGLVWSIIGTTSGSTSDDRATFRLVSHRDSDQPLAGANSLSG